MSDDEEDDDYKQLISDNDNIHDITHYPSNSGDSMFDLFDQLFDNLVVQDDYDQYGYRRPKGQKPDDGFGEEHVTFYELSTGKYTIDQLVCIGQALTKMGNKERLNRFIEELNFEVIAKSEPLLCLYLSYQLRKENFTVIIDTIASHQFDELYHKRLQSLWNEAHYKQYERRRGKYPQEVQRFRIRKKYQFPQTIWNGQQYKYLFSLKDRAKLNEFFQTCPNPNREQKVELSKITSLDFHQISTWFKNRRNRRGNAKKEKSDSNNLSNNNGNKFVKKTRKPQNGHNGVKKTKTTTANNCSNGIVKINQPNSRLC